jgi:hypothetical protein
MASREDAAAAKIQALQRGKLARQQVEAKRVREGEAAKKIQALQRGRFARQRAAELRKDLQLFVKPHSFSSEEYTVIQLQPGSLRKKARQWGEFLAALASETGREVDGDEIYYSTQKLPQSFSNRLTQSLFECLMAHDKAQAEAAVSRSKHEAIEAAKPPPPPPPPPRFDENGEEIPPPPKPRRQLREEAEQRKIDRERLQGVLDAEHKVACLATRLPNLFQIHSIKVGHLNE